jgi:hypothetical protein
MRSLVICLAVLFFAKALLAVPGAALADSDLPEATNGAETAPAETSAGAAGGDEGPAPGEESGVERRERTLKDVRVAGVVFTVLGAAVLVSGVALEAVSSSSSKGDSCGDEESECDETNYSGMADGIVGTILIVAGIAVIVPGVLMIAISSLRLKQLEKASVANRAFAFDRVSLLSTSGGNPVSGLALHFSF